MDARKFLSPQSWTYILFEFASQGKQSQELLSKLYQTEQLSTLDQVICAYGLQGNLPADEENKKMAALLAQLLKSEEEKERALALQVCNSLQPKHRLVVIAEALGSADSNPLRKELASVLQDFANPSDWKFFRALAAKEQDPSVRESLRRAEQVLRDISSRQQNRESWDVVKGNRGIREKLWRLSK